MADESLLPCLGCGGQAEMTEPIAQGQQYFQACCLACEETAPAQTNQQRAIDFWNSWNVPVDEAVADDEESAS